MPIMRALAAGVTEVKKLGPRLWQMARELFHEVTGFFFLAFAAWCIFGRAGLISLLRGLDEKPDSFPQVLLVGVLVAVLSWFGISSFLRARRVSRGQ